jgi:hypothetical protein
MLKKNGFMAVVFALILGTVASGATEAKLEENPSRLETRTTAFEFGIGGGFPSGLAVTLGAWNIGGSPILARASVGTLGTVSDIETEVGLMLDNSGTLKQYLALNAGYLPSPYNNAQTFIGPEFGFILWDHLVLAAGVGYYAPTSRGPYQDPYRVLPIAKASYSWYF